MKKQALLILATAAALIAGTRAARYLQLNRTQPLTTDVESDVIPEDTQPVTVDTSIGKVTFKSNHAFVPQQREFQRGHAVFVYLPAGYGFGKSDEHNEYVQRLSLALLRTTNGRFRMEPVPSIAEGGDPQASAIISAGSNSEAYWKNRYGDESDVLAGTPLAYARYMGNDPAPNFDETVKLVTFLIEHDRYVEQTYRHVASMIEEAQRGK